MTTKTRRDRTNRGSWWTLKRRRRVYAVAVALGGLALTYGIVDQEQLGAWVAVAAALAGTGGLALANPTED